MNIVIEIALNAVFTVGLKDVQILNHLLHASHNLRETSKPDLPGHLSENMREYLTQHWILCCGISLKRDNTVRISPVPVTPESYQGEQKTRHFARCHIWSHVPCSPDRITSDQITSQHKLSSTIKRGSIPSALFRRVSIPLRKSNTLSAEP